MASGEVGVTICAIASGIFLSVNSNRKWVIPALRMRQIFEMVALQGVNPNVCG